MQMDEMWKKMKYLIDLVQDAESQDTGAEFILLKDLHKQSFRLYKKDN